MQLNDTRWGNWLRETTGGKSTREIGERIGVTHTTVQRWSKSGIPPKDLFKIALRFNVDLFSAVIAMGWVTLEDTRGSNVGFLLQQIPTEKLTEELHRRALEQRSPKYEVQSQGHTPGVTLHRSDQINRQSFRLTSKN